MTRVFKLSVVAFIRSLLVLMFNTVHVEHSALSNSLNLLPQCIWLFCITTIGGSCIVASSKNKILFYYELRDVLTSDLIL